MVKKTCVCSVGDIDEEDAMRFDHAGRSLIIGHELDGKYFATDVLRTHENKHLSEGVVGNFDIEFPRHFGAFDYRTGDLTVSPASVALKTHPVFVDDYVFVEP